MAGTFLTPDTIAREAQLLLRNNLVAARLFDRRYEGNFTGEEKVGDTVRVRRRDEGIVDEFTEGGTVTEREVTETQLDVKLEKHFDATVRVSSRDLTLNIQDFSEQILLPHMITMAERIDTYALSKLKDLPTVGGNSETAPGSLPNSTSALAQVRKTLNIQKVPTTDRWQIVSPDYEAILLGTGEFTKANERGDGGTALENATLGRLMGFQFAMDQNVDTSTFTSGTQTAAVTNGETAANSNTIVMDGGAVSNGTLVAGDIITIAGYGNATVAIDVSFAGSAATVTIVERTRKIIADNSAVTVYDGGANTRAHHGAAIHPRAMSFVSIPLVLPPDANGSIINFDGMNLRVVRGYQQNTKRSILSIDVLIGAQVADGRLGTQIVENIA